MDAPQRAAQIKLWRQGDVTLGPYPFVYRFNPENPATEGSQGLSDSGLVYAEEEVPGLVVVTQTCDIVRNVSDRPYVEVSPLVEVDAAAYSQIKKRTKPQFVVVPAVEEKLLVADLDRVMTVEKPVLLEWPRVEGCRTDEERRRFSEALARKRARPAFPDSFGQFLSPLRDKLKKAFKKTNDESKVLASLNEIRVQPSPDWTAQSISVHFWFILDRGSSIDRNLVDTQVKKWVSSLPSGTAFSASYGVVSHSDMSAAEYIASYQLDFDDLS